MPILISIIIFLAIAALFLLYKVVLLRRAMKEIRQQVKDRIDGKTSSAMRLTSSDKEARALSESLESSLSDLQEERQKLVMGDKDLRKNITAISHDLRTPLTAIHSYANLLEEDISSEERKEYISRIRERTNELREMTEELFKYSVSQDPQYQSQLEVEKLDLRRVVEDSLLSFYNEFQKKDLVPEMHFPEEPVWISYNRKTAMRIFDNLFSNASKYADGALSVTVLSDGTVITENPTVELTPVMVSKMFDKYFTVNDGKESTGVGLSIARNLISENGGTISAELISSSLKKADQNEKEKEKEKDRLLIRIRLCPVCS